MPSESFRISTFIGASPEEIYEAWLSSDGHSAMTGGDATVDPSVGGRFTAWGPYIQGKTLELEPSTRIVQAWRTSEFSPDDDDSRIEVSFEAQAGGTQLTLVHENVPEGQGTSYRSGWEEFYFGPMRRYFLRNADTERPPPVAKPAARAKALRVAPPKRPARPAREKPTKRTASAAKASSRRKAAATKSRPAAPAKKKAAPAKTRPASAKTRAASAKTARSRGRSGAKKKSR